MPKNIKVESDKAKKDDDGNTILNVPGVCWFTNLVNKKRTELLETPYLYSKKDELYPDLYKKYANYDAIDVSRVAEIPMDYKGVMGVPVTFMDKYNPDQFEIVGMAEDNGRGYSGVEAKWDGINPHCVIDGENKFKRIFIKRKETE